MFGLKRSFFVLLLSLFLAFAFTAGELIVVPEAHQAEARRKRRKSKKKKKTEQKKEESKDELKGALGEKKKKEGIDIEELKIKEPVAMDSKIGRHLDDSIQKLLMILERHPGAPTLRRLAEIYWKKANQLNLDYMRKHQGKMDKWFEAGQKGDPPKEPDPDIWQRYNRKVVEICKLIMERFSDFGGMDEVYQFMGYNLNQIGREAEATEYYKKLVREFPNSPFVPDSWMAIGDYYFSHNNVYDALPAYQEVLKYDSSKVFGFAKYKIGWCYYNLGKYRDAIDTFKEVVAWSQDQKKRGKSQITLMEEALKDLVMAFAEDGSVDEAEKYFLSVGGKKYFRMMLVKLADIYTNQGKLDESVVVYKRLIKEYPLHKDNPDFQMKIVEAYSNKNDKENTTKEILEMVYYAKPPEESKWVAANIKAEPEIVQEAWSNAERMLIKTVVEYHKEALKIKSEDTWDKTQKLYELYLQYFKKSDKYYKVSYNYAELLWTRNDFKNAGFWYTKVAEMDRKGEFFEEASYSAILSYEKLVHKEIDAWIKDTKARGGRKDKNYKLQADKTKSDEQAKELAEKFAKRELSENTQGFVKACNIYIDNIKKSKYLINIIYKVATIYYAHNHFPEAVNRFKMIVNDYPKHRLAVFSANLILDSLNISQKWRELHATVKEYLNNPRLAPKGGRAAFRKDLRDLYEKSAFKKVEMTEAEKRWVPAAEEYLAFAKEFKKSSVRDKALYNASVHYVTAGDLETSITIQNQFLKEHKKSPLADPITYNLGKNYEALAYYPEAADIYEAYTKEYPKGKHFEDALFNASVFHQNLGHTDKSVAMRRTYMAKSKKPAEKDELLFGIAFVYIDAKDTKNAEKAFKEYLKSRKDDITWPIYDKKTEEMKKKGAIKGDPNKIYAAHLGLLNIYREQNRKDEEKETLDTFLKLAQCKTDQPLGEAARDAIAEATFIKIAPKYAEYSAFQLQIKKRMPKDKWNELMLEKLDRKAKFALEMKTIYEEKVVSLKSPKWTVAALYQIGNTYEQYSLSLFNADKPYWLTMDQQMIYDERLAQRAEPLEHQALIFYENCLRTAFKTGIYSNYAKMAREKLQGYAPDVYIPVQEIKLTPGFESESAHVAQVVTPDVPDWYPPRPTAPAAGPGTGASKASQALKAASEEAAEEEAEADTEKEEDDTEAAE